MRPSHFRFAVISVLMVMALVITAPAMAYTVKKGDTLWDLVGGRYREVARANHIANPDLILIGQEINLSSTNGPVHRHHRPAAFSTTHPTRHRHRHFSSSASPHRSTGSDNVNGGVWDRIAACESSGNWHNRDTGHNGHYGGLQFSLSSWRAVGGSGNPADASKSEQIMRANRLLALQGWGAWSCAGAR